MTELVDSTDGVRVALHDLGGTGPNLLILHATGFHGRAYQAVANHLHAHFHVHAADLRGHGDSRVTDSSVSKDETYAWAGMTDDALAAIDAMGGQPLHVVGHSMGGAVSIMIERRRPGLVMHGWAYEPIIFPPDYMSAGENGLAESARRRREVFESRDAAFERYGSRPPLSVFDPAALRDYVDFGFHDQDDGTVILACRGEVEAAVFEASFHDTFDHLGSIAAAFTIAGSGDGGPPALIAPQVADRLPNGRFEEFADLTHFGPFEDPGRIARSITDSFGLS